MNLKLTHATFTNSHATTTNRSSQEFRKQVLAAIDQQCELDDITTKCVFIQFVSEVAAGRAMKTIDLLLSFLKLPGVRITREVNDKSAIVVCVPEAIDAKGALLADLVAISVADLYHLYDPADHGVKSAIVWNDFCVGVFGARRTPLGLDQVAVDVLRDPVSCDNLSTLRIAVENSAFSVDLSTFWSSKTDSLIAVWEEGQGLVKTFFRNIVKTPPIAIATTVTEEKAAAVGELLRHAQKIVLHVQGALEYLQQHQSHANNVYISGIQNMLCATLKTTADSDESDILEFRGKTLNLVEELKKCVKTEQ